MAISHARSGDVVSVRPLGEKLCQATTTTLVKTDRLEVLRMVLPGGKRIRRHQVPGEITLQCLEGQVRVDLGDRVIELAPSELTYLDGHCTHDLQAVQDSTVLVTILLLREPKTSLLSWPSVLVEELSELQQMGV
jgi:quercetin dioxygenase-like cupin family protein